MPSSNVTWQREKIGTSALSVASVRKLPIFNGLKLVALSIATESSDQQDPTNMASAEIQVAKPSQELQQGPSNSYIQAHDVDLPAQ